VIVNNAGAGSYGPLEFAKEGTIDLQFNVNVRDHQSQARAPSSGRWWDRRGKDLMALRRSVPIGEYLSTIASNFA
jgi:hypothetical protein